MPPKALVTTPVATDQNDDVLDPRLRLVLAAEKEFAREGIDRASLRRIAMLAGNGNNNAVKYYFENRAGLVRALLTYRIQQMEAQRTEMLNLAECNGELDSIGTLLEIYCLPQFSLRDSDGHFPYARFLLQFYAFDQDFDYRRAIAEVVSVSPAIRRTRSLMIDCLSMDPVSADNRIALCHGMFLTMMIRSEPHHDDRHRSDLPLQVSDTLEMMVAAITAPRSGRDVQIENIGVLAPTPLKNLAQKIDTPSRLTALEEENAALKQLIGELSVERARLKSATKSF